MPEKSMNICMMTNTYKPLLGGLEKSVESFAQEFRAKGHRVLIVAPEFEGTEPEEDVVRIPALQKVNGSQFSIQLPIPGVLNDALGGVKWDIVHSHHPFFMGDTALRVASRFGIPLVFTHHTLYEENVHYLPLDQEAMKRFVVELAAGYANLADQVFAPSESVREMLRKRGVLDTPIVVVPTGIDVKRFSKGAPKMFRRNHGVPDKAFVLGHLGRLAPEKNLEFLRTAVLAFMKNFPEVHFMVAGKGPCEEAIQQCFINAGMADRLHLLGPLHGKAVVDAYHAMDVFVFASQSETQGLVLCEAMASGVPVVAVDAPGVRDVVKDRKNGCLLPLEDAADFGRALSWMLNLSPERMKNMRRSCHETASAFDMRLTADRALEAYTALSIRQGFARRVSDGSPWEATSRLILAQWGLMKNLTKAAQAMVGTAA